MNIPKYLSQQGIMSRREAEAYLIQGLITCNGTIVTNPALKIDPAKDRIEVLPEAQRELENKTTIAYHKPRGETSDKLNGLNSVGRLDKESEGLLLFSNDGPMTKAVTSGDHLIEKEYEVTVREKVLPTHIRQLEAGIKLEDGMTKPARAKRTSPHSFTIILKEGRNHQIRRMANALRLTVTDLKRVRIGHIKLANLKPGSSRPLTSKEITELKGYSSNIPSLPSTIHQ